LDAAHLPYNKPLLDYLYRQHYAGRKLYLATGADRTTAEHVAMHLNIFTDVLSSDGKTNLTGKNKLVVLKELGGETGFDYIGNASPDTVLLAASVEPMVANPSASLLHGLRKAGVKPAQRFDDTRPFPASLLKAIRIHQWAKNILLFLPMLLAHLLTVKAVLSIAGAFLSFSLCASATYLINDLLDIESDRQHPRKRNRPFASGDLSILTGIGIILAFLAIGACIAALLPHGFFVWLAFYALVTLSYSLYFKRKPLIDVILLSGLYTVRLFAGATATGTPVSAWLGSFSIFFFLSLAIVKRFAELENLRERGKAPANGRGYLLADIEQLRAFGTASAYAAVVVFTLYISNAGVISLYRHSTRMWLIIPLLLLWLNRVWLLASRGILDEDPVIFAIRDRTSWLLGLGVLLVALASL
jgi:4-hydroxybenzoate polyprenyltransferase